MATRAHTHQGRVPGGAFRGAGGRDSLIVVGDEAAESGSHGDGTGPNAARYAPYGRLHLASRGMFSITGRGCDVLSQLSQYYCSVRYL